MAIQTRAEVRRLFEAALDSFVAKLRQDRHILAAILFGSLSYDEVWEKSDIDLWLIGDEEKGEGRHFSLVENGINIHASLYSRSRFRRLLEGSLGSSFFHSSFSRSRLLFSVDSALEQYYQDAQRLGAHDRDMRLMNAATSVLPRLAKAEKWFHVKQDLDYCLLWLLYTVEELAAIEVLLHGEITSREVLQQAMRLNPAFFRAVYTDLLRQSGDAEALREALRAVNAYVDEKVHVLFRPLLEYLEEAGGPRSATDLNAYFEKRAQTEILPLACEWLADREVIQKLSSPIRLTEKSRVAVEEAAYYYHGEGAA